MKACGPPVAFDLPQPICRRAARNKIAVREHAGPVAAIVVAAAKYRECQDESVVSPTGVATFVPSCSVCIEMYPNEK